MNRKPISWILRLPFLPVAIFLFFLVPSAFGDVIVDNGDPGVLSTGTWQVSGAPDPYDPDDPSATSLWSRNGATYTWPFDSDVSGTYEVLMWWTAYPTRATTISVDVTHQNGVNTKTVNQRENGGAWYSLGQWYFSKNSNGGVRITAANGSTVSTCADAVWYRLVSENQPPTAYIDSISPDQVEMGDPVEFVGHGTDTDGTVAAYQWQSNMDGVLSESNSFVASDLSEGSHTIYFKVQDDDGLWSNEATEVVTVESASEPPAPSTDITIDNTDAQTSRTGSWPASSAPGPYGLDALWSRDGNTFTWRFTPPQDGVYEIRMWWTNWPSRSTNVPVDIKHSAGNTTVRVNQRQTLSDWYNLGSYPFEAGSVYAITVTAQPGPSSTCADALRFSYKGGFVSTSKVIDNDDPGTSYTKTWPISGAPDPYGDNALWARDGATYTWTFRPEGSGYYGVSMYWTDWPSRATNVPVDIKHAGGTTRVYVNQRQTLTDWYRLGYYFFEANSNYDVTITAQPAPTSTCADAIAFGEPPSLNGSTDAEQIFACIGYFETLSVENNLISMLQSKGAQKVNNDLWKYHNQITNKDYDIHMVRSIEGMKQALKTQGSCVVYSGHSNYGLGSLFSTKAETSAERIDDLLYIDDDRLFTVSSPWIEVRCPGMRTSQAFPNWWWAFKDRTVGVMPYVFGDPNGDPAYNYYITYQLPGDPTHYKVETVRNGAIKRFGCDSPPWYSPDGTPPDPLNPAHQQYFITTPLPWYPSFETFGSWTGSQTLAGYRQENYIYTPNDGNGDRAEWTLRIPQAGTYEIFAWWPASSTQSYNAPYTVNHSLGTTTFYANQRLNGNRWNSLGRFYFEPGNYPVVLSDDADGGNVVADAIKIVQEDDPDDLVQAHFYAKVRSGSPILEVDFESQSTGDITYLQWEFGDGETEEDKNTVSHDYTKTGAYTVSLTVSGPSGTNKLTKTNYIRVGSQLPLLEAEFSKELATDTLPMEVRFQDHSSGNPVSWLWNFGDGETSTEQNPEHTYYNAGYYTVSLRVTDENNATDLETKANFVKGAILSRSLDNVDYPKPHCGEKTLIFRKDLEIAKEDLKYSRFFYNGCSTGKYYLETFMHGIVFYTLDTSDAQIWMFVKAFIEGKSDGDIWEILQDYEPLYDYFDFSKKPTDQ